MMDNKMNLFEAALEKTVRVLQNLQMRVDELNEKMDVMSREIMVQQSVLQEVAFNAKSRDSLIEWMQIEKDKTAIEIRLTPGEIQQKIGELSQNRMRLNAIKS